MFTRNVSVRLKSNMFSQNGMWKLIVGGALLGLLTGVCFAQRASQQPSPSARPGPTANTSAPNANQAAPNPTTVAPNVPTVAPNVPTVAPNVPTVAPNANPVAPNVPTVAPNAPTVAPDANTVAPTSETITPDANPGPNDMIQKPPVPPNPGVSPDAAPPSSKQ